MTVERRTLVTLQDITAMEYECSHCKARYSVALERIDRIPSTCPNCHERWFSETQSNSSTHSDYVALRHFLDFLGEMRSRNLGATIRLEVALDRPTELRAVAS